RHVPQGAVVGDQRLLQRRGGRADLPAARELPAQQLPGVAVDRQGQRQPAIPAMSPSADLVRSLPTATPRSAAACLLPGSRKSLGRYTSSPIVGAAGSVPTCPPPAAR